MKSTLKIGGVLALSILLTPGAAWAGKAKRHKPSCNPQMDITCAAQPVAYTHKVPGVRSSSSGGFSGGWMCKTRGDEFDKYRRVQNESSRKQAETFFTNSAIGAANPVVSAVMYQFSPSTLIGLLVNAFSFGNNYSNLNDQQRIACKNLELRIEEIKNQRAMLTKSDADRKIQLQQIALDLGKQIPLEVQKQVAAMRREIENDPAFNKHKLTPEDIVLILQELDKRGMINNPEPENTAPPQVSPEEKPSPPEGDPAIPPGPGDPTVSAPAPKSIVPSMLNEAVIPESEINLVSQDAREMIKPR